MGRWPVLCLLSGTVSEGSAFRLGRSNWCPLDASTFFLGEISDLLWYHFLSYLNLPFLGCPALCAPTLCSDQEEANGSGKWLSSQVLRDSVLAWCSVLFSPDLHCLGGRELSYTPSSAFILNGRRSHIYLGSHLGRTFAHFSSLK